MSKKVNPIEHFIEKTKALTLFATHYHELIEVVDGYKNANAQGVKIYNFSKDEVEIGYTLISGKEIRKTVKK